MKYCSDCGSEKLMFAIPPGDNRERIICSSCEMIHYINPRIIVGALIVDNSKVMLCRRSIEPRLGLWNLPAGFLENNETAENGAIRETLEESLAKIKVVKLHCVYSIPSVNQVYLHFLANMAEPGFGVTSESSEVKFFAEDEIPWDELAFTSTEFALKKYFENTHALESHVGSIHTNY